MAKGAKLPMPTHEEFVFQISAPSLIYSAPGSTTDEDGSESRPRSDSRFTSLPTGSGRATPHFVRAAGTIELRNHSY
jgi:hypothetical protein